DAPSAEAPAPAPTEAETAEAIATEEVAELRRQLEETQAKADEYLDQWRRSVAEFSNFRKRMERDRQEFQKTATTDFLKRLLPVVDDMERAFAHLPAELASHEWIIGMQMVYQKLLDLLYQEGLQPIEAENSRFDPLFHEAVSYEESPDHEDGAIIGVVRRGYRLGERVLRPAQVRVARRIEASEAGGAGS
ncbi:MAG: nucleotide exchange factor GrpE, partial [Anaerolineae bacterium]